MLTGGLVVLRPAFAGEITLKDQVAVMSRHVDAQLVYQFLHRIES